MSFFSKIFGDANERYLKKLQPIIEEINSLENQFERLSAIELVEKTAELKQELANGKTLDDILPTAFALVRESAKRTLAQRHYDVQLIGGIVLHQGKIAEMKTGEGKTLAATLAAYLNALSGEGVHIVTVNDYLAKRDTVWMGQIYHALGLSVGCIVHEAGYIYDPHYIQDSETVDKYRDIVGGFKVIESYLRPVSRHEAYAADITYGTNNEFGFDYLRDNMVYEENEIVQRGHNFAIVDEVDSILIDEARTPLIISVPDEESSKLYQQFAKVVLQLEENIDYNVDEKIRSVTLTDNGIEKVEKILGIKNMYVADNIRMIHHLEEALKAQVLFKKDKDYIVKNGEVIIVDEFTGRLMYGRRYSEGLHQAIEAKEGVPIQSESRTMGTITFQNYFRMYKKLSGMTGTAATSAEEFHKVYGMDVVVVPTNKPIKRIDAPDIVYKTEEGKFKAVVEEIKRCHEIGQPILVGTISIEKNEALSRLLRQNGIKHEILNAKNHEREAEIIAQAGKLGSVTLATNMAGRGVDIILGGNPPNYEEQKKVVELGGLYVLGTEHHEARRIDNQLRGRSGRQGDPGITRFFVSLEDDLMRIFGGDKIKNLMNMLGLKEDQLIEHRFVAKAIAEAQAKIEGYNFDIRKHVLEFDEVLNKQRNKIYGLRKEILANENIESKVFEIIREQINKIVEAHFSINNIEEIFENIKTALGSDTPFDLRDKIIIESQNGKEALKGFLSELVIQKFQDKEKEFNKLKELEISVKVKEQNFIKAVRILMLRILDILWMNHLETMEHLRDSVRIRAYGQHDPLVEYKNEGHKVFKDLLINWEFYVFNSIFKIGAIEQRPKEKNVYQKSNYNSEISGRGNIGYSNFVKNRTNSNFSQNKKIGRNDPCPCGSGKKFKRCHGA